MRPPALAVLLAALAATAGLAPLPAAEFVLTLTDAAAAPVVVVMAPPTCPPAAAPPLV